ncbi:response regulator transcription factor [Caballeronia jiangsuensis]|uniref:Response regulator transcription factor n=1 Tax=Caballeronia jiangsuensis TaxID=1458357 RepID=A0ABW9CWS3_9BURK
MRALILDDQYLFQAAFSLLLQQVHPGIEVLQAASLKEGMDHVLSKKIDVVFVDLDLPDGGGFASLQELKRHGVALVVMSEEKRVDAARQCIEYGASGYLPKTKPPRNVEAIIAAIRAGGSFYTTTQRKEVNEHQQATLCRNSEEVNSLLDNVCVRMPLSGAAALGLTPREYEALNWLVRGLPDKAIANEMKIEGMTVRKYVGRLLAHFQVTNRGALIRLMLTREDLKRHLLFFPGESSETGFIPILPRKPSV